MYRTLLRKSVFLGLSDGARIDAFRRANVGVISNEQIVLATEIGPAKWDGLLRDLRSALGDAEARFGFVFLLDDFVATGTTLLRREEEWKGRLPKFWNTVRDRLSSHFEPGLQVIVHHYVATYVAEQTIKSKAEQVSRELGDAGWFSSLQFSFGMLIPQSVCVTGASHPEFVEVIHRYYDHSIYSDHFRLSGVDDAKLGFGALGLPLVMEHNTPNNTVALVWAETAGEQGPAMRPLFRRRQRHS